MVWKNHPLRRPAALARSVRSLVVRLFALLGGVLLLLVMMFGAGKNFWERRDRTEQQEVDVEEIPRESIEEAHEVRDVPLRPIIYAALALLVAAIVIHVGLWRLLELWTGEELRLQPQVPPAVIDGGESPAPDVDDLDRPGPNLQEAPALEYQIYLARQREMLNSYGQVEAEEEIVRIPVERAMELLAEEGLPARDGEVPSFDLEPAYQLDSQGGQESGGIWAEE